MRQKTLNLLHKHGELSVNDLVKCLTLAQSTVSHHLEILRDAHIVTARHAGQKTYYRICCNTVIACCADVLKKARKKCE